MIALSSISKTMAPPLMSLCDGCAKRASCREPCAALELVVGPEHVPAPKEFGSLALMHGRGKFAASTETADVAQLDASMLNTTQLHDAVAGLPQVQRLVIEGAFWRRESVAQIAQQLNANPRLIRRALKVALSSLRRSLNESKPNRSQQEKTKMTSVNPIANSGDGGGARCAYPGCPAQASPAPTKSPELKQYCLKHRRERRVPALTVSVEPDRAGADVLLSRVKSEEAMLVDITPALAAGLLEKNSKNRSVSDPRVEVYARDMQAGRWRINNQGLALGADGELYDGQHRLLAVMQSGCTVRMLVVRGLPSDARGTIDQGRTRTVGDALRMVDGRSGGNRIVSWFRALEILVCNRILPISHGMVQENLKRYAGTVDWFVENVPRTRLFTRAPVVAALVYAHRVAPNAVEPFTKRYLTGADLRSDSPVLALRTYVAEKMHLDKNSPRVVSVKTLQCLYSEIRGERVDRIAAKEEAFMYFRDLHDADTLSAAA